MTAKLPYKVLHFNDLSVFTNDTTILQNAGIKQQLLT